MTVATPIVNNGQKYTESKVLEIAGKYAKKVGGKKINIEKIRNAVVYSKV